MKWIESSKKEIKEDLGLSEVVHKILSNRLADHDQDEVYQFLNPTLSYLEHPKEMKDLEKASDVICKVIESGEQIAVHGDYDVDGITSTIILCKTIQQLGGDVSWWLPNRAKDGYGISKRFIEKCKKDKPSLIITVDCGITEHEKIKELSDAGIDVVITDHHTVNSEGVPKSAKVVVDPHREDESCQFKNLAGVGVAFKLCWSICEKLSSNLSVSLQDYLQWILPYVGIGTISDVMPLVGENRIIVSKALDLININCIDDGLKYLLSVSKLNVGSITSRDIGFMLAPRINSAGRMDDPSIAFDCLFNDDEGKAFELDSLNLRRKDISETLTEKAILEAAKQCSMDDVVLIISGKGWHHGVVGIVAGRVAETLGRPTIILNINDKGIASGSARSIPGFNLYNAVSASASKVLRFGGHAQALGVALNEEDIEEFRKEINREELYEKIDTPQDSEPSMSFDCEVSIQQIKPQLMRDLDKLEPFGEANPEPIFVSRGVEVSKFKTMGEGSKHFNAVFYHAGSSLRGVGFNCPQLIEDYDESTEKYDVAFFPVWNTFRGSKTLELRIKDMKPT